MMWGKYRENGVWIAPRWWRVREEKRFEWRLGWSAASNASFRDESDWMEFGGDAESAEEVEDVLQDGGSISDALEEVLNLSGFEWWLEVREAQDKGGTDGE